MDKDFPPKRSVPRHRKDIKDSDEQTTSPNRKSHITELKQLHHLELLIRNEETSGFVEYYLQNQR